MFKRTAVLLIVMVGAGVALALPAAARSFIGGAPSHLAHSHHFHFHGRFRPYGYGYGYGYGAVATYTPDYSAQPVSIVPMQTTPVDIVPAPPCTHSRETITVPAEGGGEKQVTITRC